MRHNPVTDVTDPAIVRELIAENPWATLVSDQGGELVASHYPVLLDDRSDDLAVVTHVGRPDDRTHGFGEREMLMIIAGPHGYISPSWYSPGSTRAPTWNFSVAHCHGVPQVLADDENRQVLARLVEHFERHVEAPMLLEDEVARRLAPGTVGIRLPITRFTCKVKMSQEKDDQTRRQVLAQLRGDGPYASPSLAANMTRALSRAGLGIGGDGDGDGRAS